ncbi:MAG: fibronectin type III domain-containing protein, partial [Patescibacteria group bacterium]|nr:fibronectin type III domain-containing protein [Patescibacteria group bacterium]
GQPNNPTNQTTIDITVGGEEVTHYKYKLDDRIYDNEIQVSTHIILSDLSDGEHVIYIIGKDASGNWQEQTNPTTYSWTIDTSGPVSNIIFPNDDDIFNNISWLEEEKIIGTASSDNDLAKVEIQIQKGLGTQYLDNGNATSTPSWIDSPIWSEAILDSDIASSTATWHFNLPVSLLTEDNYYFVRSRAFDLLNNIQDTVSVVEFIFDVTPPEKITGLKIEEGDSALDFTFFWDLIDDNLAGIDYYEIYDENNNWNKGNKIPVEEISFDSTGEEGVNYSFRVRACDKAGNCGEFSDPAIYYITEEEEEDKDILIVRGDNQGYSVYIPTEIPENAEGLRSKKTVGAPNVQKFGGAFWQEYESNAYTNFEFFYNPVDDGLTIGLWYYLPILPVRSYQAKVVDVYDFFSMYIVRPSAESSNIYYYVNFYNDEPDIILDMAPIPWSIGWNHLTVAVSSDKDKKASLYYNGQLVGSKVVGSVNFNIIKLYFYNGFWSDADVNKVYFDDIFFTAKELTSSQINSIYTSNQPYN